MTRDRFNECLQQIDWSLGTLAENLGCDESLTTAYSLGTEEVPVEIASWLETLAQVCGASRGRLEKMLGPSVDASDDDGRELLAEITRRAAIGRLEREHAMMKEAIRRSQYYLRLALQPGGLTAKECVSGLLQTLDNEEINEVTKRRS